MTFVLIASAPMCGLSLAGPLTALAALKLGRQFLGIEQNEEYVRLAESRIAALSIWPTLLFLRSRRPGATRRVRMCLSRRTRSRREKTNLCQASNAGFRSVFGIPIMPPNDSRR